MQPAPWDWGVRRETGKSMRDLRGDCCVSE